jgi:hypothetical protein
MSDRKHCVPNTCLCVIFILKESVKESESARKYTCASTGSYEVKGLRRLRVGIEYFLIVRGRNMATQVKERVHVCHMPSIIGKCEQILMRS